MNRRAALKALGLAAASTGLAGCAGARRPGFVDAQTPRLARVRVSPERLIRTVVGLRPYRPAGFVVRAERFDSKLVVHNYGHGGGGITLSWGTAALAVEEALHTEAVACAVIGCGAVGLASARLLQRRGRAVTIYARELPPETTSNAAGGMWSPYSVVERAYLTPEFTDQFERAARLAHRRFQDLVGPHYGVRWIDGYQLSPRPMAGDELADLFPNKAELPPGTLPFDTPYAARFTTMLVEPAVYLAALWRDFLLAGGRIVVREFHDVSELVALPEPVLVNCTGLGARDLFGDTDLIPAKGQLHVLLPQPEVDYLVLAGPGLHMFPRSDGILLGGTFEPNQWSLEPDPDQQRRIIDGHRRLFGWS